MDINEIEKLYKEAASVTWFQRAIEHLLIRLTESEGALNVMDKVRVGLVKRVKELEQGIEEAVKKISDRKSYVILGPRYIAPIEHELRSLLPKKE